MLSGRIVTVDGMLGGRMVWVRMSGGQFEGECNVKVPEFFILDPTIHNYLVPNTK
jgi:hypothetical protein